MLTRNRRQWLPKAIRCYRSQTYPNRELLILSDGEDVCDLVPADDATIRIIHLEGCANIGEKRNFGCSRASGEIVAHFDDDDYSAPGRLADQCVRLQDSGKAVTGYRSMRFSQEYAGGPQKWWLFEGLALDLCQPGMERNRTLALGTSLCYRRAWWDSHPFPTLQICEDSGFANEAWRHGELVTAPAGDLMYATMHDGNTSPKVIRGTGWTEL